MTESPTVPVGSRPTLTLSPETSGILDRVVIVLSRPQNVVNIAAVIRGMKNMGLSRLRLVQPDDFDTYRIGGIAHRSDEIVASTQTFETLAEAVADAVLVVGTTARARTAGLNYSWPREMMPTVVEKAATGTVAIVFGREDRGLTNQELDLCDHAVIVPTGPYSSLNLAQAALILMYELFMEAGGGARDLPLGRRATRPATHEELEEMYGALEAGLHRIEFYKARKAESVMRTLRTILGQADLDLRESRLIRAIGFEIGHYLDRLMHSGGEATSSLD